MSGRSPLRGSGLRPSGAEPQDASQAEPLVPNAEDWLRALKQEEALARLDAIAAEGQTGVAHALSRAAFQRTREVERMIRELEAQADQTWAEILAEATDAAAAAMNAQSEGGEA